MEEFLNSLGINGDFTESDEGSLVLTIPDSNAYGQIYSKLDKSDEIEEDIESSNINMMGSTIQFSNDNYLITLIGDLDADTYQLVIKQL